MRFIVALAASVLLSTTANADSFSVIVNQRNGLNQLDVNTARVIYAGRIDDWQNVPGSGLHGEIFALALASSEPETQAFLNAVNLDALGGRVIRFSGPLGRLIIALAAELIPNVIGIDNPSVVRPRDKSLQLIKNFSVIVNRSGNALNEIGADTARRIFDGEFTDWSSVPGANLTGPILALRLGDSVHATQAFASYVQLSQFGVDVNIVTGSAAPFIIAVNVAMNSHAIAVDDPAAVIAADKDLPIDP